MVVSKVHDEVGGSLGAYSINEMPCNQRQVYNAGHQVPTGQKGEIHQGT